jgi:hypothetical protein
MPCLGFQPKSQQSRAQQKTGKGTKRGRQKRCVCVCANAWQLGMAQRVSPATFRSQKRGYSQYPRAPLVTGFWFRRLRRAGRRRRRERPSFALHVNLLLFLFILSVAFFEHRWFSEFFSPAAQEFSQSAARIIHNIHDWPARGAEE